jgi:hypothetical protein
MKLLSILDAKLKDQENNSAVVEGLQMEPDTEWMEEELTKALTNKPKKFTGKADVYDGDFTIDMENGDKIRVAYKGGAMPGSKMRTTVTINNSDKLEFNDEGGELVDKIHDFYYGRKK